MADGDEALTVGAIPWCIAGHDTDWVEGCPFCTAAQGIVASVEAHFRAYGCPNWPVCIDGHGGPCDAVTGADGLDG